MLPGLLALSSLILSARGVTTILQFPNGTWLENLGLRPDGSIVLTELNPSPVLIYVDPSAPTPAAQTVHSFPPPATGLSGVAQPCPDVFVVVSYAFNFTTLTPTPGTCQVWQVDMTAYPGAPAVVTPIANATDIVFPNGATALPGSSIVLVADYAGGRVYGVDTVTGAVAVAVDDAGVNVPANATGGVNGVHAPGDGWLYFTNSGAHSFGRVPIDGRTGAAAGPAEILFQNATVTPDDFALDPDGGSTAAYVADSANDRVIHVDGTSNDYQDAGAIAGATAVAVSGVGIYVSSTGGDYEYEQNPIPVGGALSLL